MVSFKLGKEIEKDAFTKKTSFSISIPSLQLNFFLILFKNYDAIDTADPNSMQDRDLLTIESLWLSDRVSECRIQRSEVWLLIRTQNFFYEKNISIQYLRWLNVHNVLDDFFVVMWIQAQPIEYPYMPWLFYLKKTDDEALYCRCVIAKIQ